MKHLLLTTIAAVVLVGCGPSVPDISIHDAANSGNIEAIKQHLAAGTDVNAKDKNGRTPLPLAAVYGYKEIAELLLAKGADVNAKDEEGETPLHLAAEARHKEVAELLITKGADVNAKDDDGSTPLHHAAFDGYKEIAELLIAAGAEVNAKDDRLRKTPLDLAINYNQTETVDLLRKHGGISGAADSIHLAAAVGNIEVVKQHLAAGVDVNAKGYRGFTPLHYEARNGHKEIAELLIAKGANVNVKDDAGETPLDLADGETADLLRKHGGKTKRELEAAEK